MELNLYEYRYRSFSIIYTFSVGQKPSTLLKNSKCLWLCRDVYNLFLDFLRFLPNDMTFTNALHIAGANDKMKIVSFYWSGG
jgi:hypothetical protein